MYLLDAEGNGMHSTATECKFNQSNEWKRVMPFYRYVVITMNYTINISIQNQHLKTQLLLFVKFANIDLMINQIVTYMDCWTSSQELQTSFMISSPQIIPVLLIFRNRFLTSL